jgi:hypothetical protein
MSHKNAAKVLATMVSGVSVQVSAKTELKTDSKEDISTVKATV